MLWERYCNASPKPEFFLFSLFIFSFISRLIWIRLGWNFHRWFSIQKQVNWCTIDPFSLQFCTSQHSYPVPLKQRCLNEKTGKCMFTLYKPNGQLRGPQCVYAPCLLSTWNAPVTSIFVGRANVVCFVSLLIHRVIHTTLWTSQTTADHEQGAWSVTGARSLVKWCVQFIVPLFGNAQYGIAYF